MLQLSRLTILAATTASIISAHPTSLDVSFSWQHTRHLISFGDSYTYVQGTRGYVNSSFVCSSQEFSNETYKLTVQIGSALDISFTPEELLSNRIVQNQTSTAEGGPNYVEFMTGCGVKSGLTNPRDCSKQLWDFAFGGADISTAYTPLHHNYTTSLVNQTIQFERYAEPVLSDFIDKRRTLVSFWIGINDINDSAKYEVDFPTFYDKLVTTLFERIERIYCLGYKNFLLMKLPPLDRTPANQKRKSGVLPNATMIEWYNDALANHAGEFQRLHPSTKVMMYDTTKFLNHVLDDPTPYGIKNTTDFCAAYDQPNINADPASYGCLTLDEFFWFNAGHLTSHTHELLAANLVAFLEEQ